MSFELILEIVMMLGLGGALYVVARTLPRIDDTDTTPQNPLAPAWFLHYLEIADEWLLSTFEKILHKLRVTLLRFDNAMLKRIGRLKKLETKEVGFPTEVKGGEDEKVLLEKEDRS